MTLLKSVTATILIALSTCAYATLNLEQQSAKERGIVLFKQYKTAEPELRIAAEAGDAEAQFFLAEEIRQEKQYITNEAYKWYEAAANQGDLYSMIRIGRTNNDLCTTMKNCPTGKKEPKEWLAEATKIAKDKSDHGDAEALYIMYELTAERDWLEKSALAGDAIAQYRMAIGDRQGEGYILPWKRQEAVEHWFLLSAKAGNPKAMMQLFGIYREKNELEQARYWVEKAALKGYEAGVYNYGYFLAVDPEALGFTEDKVKGYALISLLKELNGGGSIQTDIEETLPQIAEKMTPTQIQEAEEFAAKWKDTHPPLSFFPEKIGF
ncbi:tetratricopeptide repeat protein [Pseudomonas hamedanensis]|uniref:Sel1 repeat family protein n=1 Tax=Pseudomonas hamedanensis TaxID=2745504 RepID=A0A9E6THP3_9PSED|nr:sel1 repeat family protein [Pseudomonas hamedanensis]QXI18109.1 sel1 repeat family protein [Pseudomonas hamedanensis]